MWCLVVHSSTECKQHSLNQFFPQSRQIYQRTQEDLAVLFLVLELRTSVSNLVRSRVNDVENFLPTWVRPLLFLTSQQNYLTRQHSSHGSRLIILFWHCRDINDAHLSGLRDIENLLHIISSKNSGYEKRPSCNLHILRHFSKFLGTVVFIQISWIFMEITNQSYLPTFRIHRQW